MLVFSAEVQPYICNLVSRFHFLPSDLRNTYNCSDPAAFPESAFALPLLLYHQPSAQSVHCNTIPPPDSDSDSVLSPGFQAMVRLRVM